ncbi:MAG TPA: hypothetical protein PLC54_05835, partial [Spirochaetales bacterium]|nr:hypothetical protein [Spirochaetales bacterium]
TRSGPTWVSGSVYQVEVVRTALYDIGRSVDLKLAASLLPGTPGMRIVRRRDTPGSLTMPTPLCVDLRSGKQKAFCDDAVEGFTATARLYDEGVMSIVVRLMVNATLEDLHSIETKPVSGNIADLDSYISEKYRAMLELVAPAVVNDKYNETPEDREMYTAFCFSDVGQPSQFMEQNRKELTTLLVGEQWQSPVHESQIKKTLSNPFSYSQHDLALFDMDRCLIIDASRDYEDVLLICELANYQFLELRTLDRLLDRWLDEAEDDVQAFYGRTTSQGRRKRKRKAKVRSGALQRKLAVIQALRLDALFILENLENSAKIIGDYFLGTVYEHLTGIFNTAGWTRSVERRLDALQNVYEIVKGDKNERTMLVLEIVFIVVCIIPIIQFALG